MCIYIYICMYFYISIVFYSNVDFKHSAVCLLMKDDDLGEE